MTSRRHTISEIATIFASADSIGAFEENPRINQLRHLDKRSGLIGGRAIDGRGTKAFPTLEVYRARILCALLDFGLDAATFQPILSEARTLTGSPVEFWPDRTLVEGLGRVWRGFEDVVRGVQEHGENWVLEIRLNAVTRQGGKISAEYVWLDNPNSEPAAYGAIVLNLRRLFAGLPPLEA